MTRDYIFLMHGGSITGGAHTGGWSMYLARLQELGVFQGGGAIGGGRIYSKGLWSTGISDQITGYIRIQADDLEAARLLLAGNPVFEAGGLVEIRELPRDEAGE